MTRIPTSARLRLPVAVFTAGVLLLALLVSLPGLTALGELYMFIPAGMAILCLLLFDRGRSGWASLGVHRLGLRQWPIAVLLPVVVLGGGYALTWALVPSARAISPYRGLSMVIAFVVFTVLNTVSVSLGEELGWRGWLQPRARALLGRLGATVFTAVVWTLFHFPLIFLAGGYNEHGNRAITTVLFALVVTALSFILGVLRERSGSVWPASLLHSAHNTAWALAGTLLVPTTPVATYVAGESGAVAIVGYAIAALILWRRSARPAGGERGVPGQRDARPAPLAPDAAAFDQ